MGRFSEWIGSPPEAKTQVLAGDEAGKGPKPPPLAGYPVRDLGEIFNFNITAKQIQQRWRRISTATNLSEILRPAACSDSAAN